MKKFDMNSKILTRCKRLAAFVLIAAALVMLIAGTLKLNQIEQTYRLKETRTFYRVTDTATPEAAEADAGEAEEEAEEEDYEDNLLIPVTFTTEDGAYSLKIDYHYEAEPRAAGGNPLELAKGFIQGLADKVEPLLIRIAGRTAGNLADLPEDACVTGYIYENNGGESLCFDHEASERELVKAVRNENADSYAGIFSAAMALVLAGVAFAVTGFFGRHFTNYEQLWFLIIMVVAAVVSILAPEESANGVNGLVIMALYLADTFLNLLCELLISKQSKWNFIVSVFVEITEIAICLVLMYRFATLASTLFFWLPCDIISFISWHRHPDRQEEELTRVRTLKGWQEALIIAFIVVWTLGVGYFLSNLSFVSDFIQNRTVEVIVAYMDACVTAVGVANGLFILFRFREQWIAWYIDAALEAAINILSGQFVLLVLKVGYFTNTTYGYIKWTKYIRSREALPDTVPPAKAKKE